MNESELRKYTKELCEEAGSVVALAKKFKVSHSYLSTFLRGECPPGAKILKALKVKKCFRYIRKGETVVMRFEDI